MQIILEKYKHICFEKKWKIDSDLQYKLGQCNALIKSISNTPISPDYRERLLTVSLIKGAQATTAIEGNTLTFEEIESIRKGTKLPQSKEYLEIEVKNILNAFNTILRDVIVKNKIIVITPDLILHYHRMVGRNLGKHFDAIPGKFRKNNVIVGNYKPPDYDDVPQLVEKLCSCLKEKFHFEKEQSFSEAVIQAIITHIYIAWIHPFSDGNGRTARLLEFYLLLRAGVPDIASHILSNFYNLTRSEYYRQLEKSINTYDITEFINYAIQGFLDELHNILSQIQENQLEITWRNYIYEIFEKKKAVGRSVQAIKRRRNFLLQIPIGKIITIEDILNSNPIISKMYAPFSERVLYRDLKILEEMKLLHKTENGYRVQIEILRKYMPSKSKKHLTIF